MMNKHFSSSLIKRAKVVHPSESSEGSNSGDTPTNWDSLFTSLDIPLLLPELHPEDKGDYYIVDCPNCGQHEAYIYKDNQRVIKCNRGNKCMYSTDVWNCFQNLHGLSNSETYNYLTQNAGFEVKELTAEEIQKKRALQQKQDVLAEADRFFKAQLPGSPTEEYLLKRGLPEEALEDFGHNPGYVETVKHLESVGFAEKLIKDTLFLMDSKDDYQLIIPYRLPNKDVLTFIARRLNPKDSKQAGAKYVPIVNFKRNICFGADKLKNPDRIYIVEGYIDAILMQHMGFPTVALGSSTPANGQIEHLLERYKAKSIVLCLDKDEAGFTGTEKLFYQLRSAGKTPYIVDLFDCKDPNDYVSTHGIKDFQNQCKYPEKDYNYLIRQKLEPYTASGPLERDELIDEVIKMGSIITNPIESEDFNAIVSELTGITKEIVNETLGDAKRKQAEEELGKSLISTMNGARDLVSSGKPSEALKQLLETTEGLKGLNTEELPNTVYTEERLMEELNSVPDGIKTGIEELDKVLTLPSEGVTVLAGVSRHGKTTTMLNFLNNALNNPDYGDKTFIYASFEETTKRLIVKLTMMNAQEILSSENNFSESVKYLKKGFDSNTWVNIAKKKVLKLTQEYRLILLDMTGKDIQNFENLVHNYSKKYDIGGVFVDYIQKIPAESSYTRQTELQKISHRLLELAKSTHVPIVLGAQFNKEGANGIDSMDLNQVREANDIGNDAHVVLGVWNTHAAAKSKDVVNRSPSDPIQFTIKVLKNRNGASNMTVDLDFYPENFTLLSRGKPYGYKKSVS